MKKKVLVVDDSVVAVSQLKRIINDSGFFEVVGHAKNGIEGIKLYASLRPDIVCMDLIMPEMDGLQALRTIMSMDKDAKIVVISSAAGVEEKSVEALRFGAKNVIQKPFEPETVVSVLKGL